MLPYKITLLIDLDFGCAVASQLPHGHRGFVVGNYEPKFLYQYTMWHNNHPCVVTLRDVLRLRQEMINDLNRISAPLYSQACVAVESAVAAVKAFYGIL